MQNNIIVQNQFREKPLRFLGRLIEIVLSATLLLIFLPLMMVIAVVICIETPGPPLFKQPRVGLGSKNFNFIKFRTMYVDAKDRFPGLYAYRYTGEEIKTLVFKSDDDPRVTGIGRWLRKSTLDELPNFWNVLVGDMALIGPRPEIPEMLPYYDTPEMRLKFSVRPGVTGLSQVSGRAKLTFLETVELDLKYVKERSVLMDLSILLKTIKSVALGIGAF